PPLGSTAKTLFVRDATVNTGATVSGGGRGVSSKAPLSHAGPWGRGTPRWSVAAHPAPTGTRSCAGLDAVIACVGVGPPFSASAPTAGSSASPGQALSGKSRLKPPSLNVPLQFAGSFDARIELVSVAPL